MSFGKSQTKEFITFHNGELLTRECAVQLLKENNGLTEDGN